MTEPTAHPDAVEAPGPLVRHERTDAGVDVLTLSHGKVNALSSAVLAELRDRVGELRAAGARAVVVTGGPKLFAAGADITEFAERGGDEPFAVAAPERVAELRDRVGELRSAGARAVVVTGGPKLFAAGADITEFAERGGDEPFGVAAPERVAEIGAGFLDALEDLAALPCPTIAAVNGVALGGGCELALACDLRVASDRARFGQPEILLGIIPGGGGTQRLARLIGPARAKDMVLTGRTVDAAEARNFGLVDRVVDGDALAPALELATALAQGPAAALALAKRAVDGGLDGTLHDGLRLEQRLFVDSFATGDAAVGVRSFLRDGPGKAQFP